MPRFVLLHHECPPAIGPSHWDLMLERNDALMTWRLGELPAAWQGGNDKEDAQTQLAAQRISDHRLAYLDYEGPVSNNRGQVTRTDQGDYAILEEANAAIRVRLRGDKLRGTITLPLLPPNVPSC